MKGKAETAPFGLESGAKVWNLHAWVGGMPRPLRLGGAEPPRDTQVRAVGSIGNVPVFS